MTRDKKIAISTSIILSFIIFFALLIPHPIGRIIASITLSFCCVSVYFLIRKRSILSINKKQVIWIILAASLLYVAIISISGIFFGFYLSLDVLNITTLATNIIPSCLIIISIEIIRRVLLSQNNKFINVMTFIMGVLTEILLYSSLIEIETFEVFMEMFGMYFVPAITFNILYTHLASKYGFVPNIICRIIITLYPYFLPFDIGTPNALISLFKLVFPIIVYYFIYSLYTNKQKQKVQKKSWLSYVTTGLLLFVMISIAMLISCKFKYGLLVIGSDSMVGELNVGDAVFFEKYEEQDIVEGQIIVFEKDNMKVVHRVDEIKHINGVKQYYTKGDANDSRDTGYIVDSNIIGVSKFKIKYFGYPTIWIREIFL